MIFFLNIFKYNKEIGMRAEHFVKDYEIHEKIKRISLIYINTVEFIDYVNFKGSYFNTKMLQCYSGIIYNYIVTVF